MNFAHLATRLCLIAAVVFATGAHGAAAPTTTESTHLPEGIAWHKGDVDSAFEQAKRDNRPLFMYWGAVWCPPCNQIKTTVFKRSDFIERSKLFVPVYMDGDARGAQQYGTRFRVRGYPTTILFRPDGSEITRLPGDADAGRYMDVLASALNASHPIREVIDAALQAKRALNADEWRLLAYYSWDTDEQALVKSDQVAQTVQRLAAACPASQPEFRARLVMKSLSLAADPPAGADTAAAKAADSKAPTDKPDSATRAAVERVLADPGFARPNFDVLIHAPDKVVKLLAADDTALRDRLARAWDHALGLLANDAHLSKADRIDALDARIALAKLADEKRPLPAALVKEIRAAAAAADHSTKDAIERQSVISEIADMLADAGLLAESDALLRAELKRSHSPYYFMLGLAANAKKRGDNKAALDWYAQAYAGAKGPATRLQWGARYLKALLELAPANAAEIERVAVSVLAEIDPVPASFEGRNLTALDRMKKGLDTWNEDSFAQPSRAGVVARLNVKWQGLCDKLPANAPQRAACARSA